MYLKKLEVYGFKSFAERIELSFGQGITGVVGPNGCGKSNIGDAVRWVLGEQNARVLRGGKMEDVIFGGTEKRRALAYCEVSLTFDNSQGFLPVDYAEVMVTRRVYRNGEGEYFLNKTACRLKDITNLFRDTGVGKEGYSLIGQGRIDEILSIRSEDRRNIFEEAAGISKYKARKEEAERRVANTEQNLERVEDILEELSSQLAPLAEQAETARRYIALTGELKALELNDFLVRHDRAKERLSAFAEQQEALSSQAEAAARGEEALRVKIDEAQAAIEAAQGELNAARDGELSLAREVEAREGQLNLLKERAAQAERDRERMEMAEREAREAMEALRQDEETASPQREERLAAMRGELTALEGRADELGEEMARREAALEESKAAIIEGMNRLSGVQAAQARLTATREGLVGRMEALASAQLGVRAQLDEAEGTLGEASAHYESARSSWEELGRKGKEAREEAEALSAEREEAAALLARTQGALREAQSRLKMLEQMERDYTGYHNSVREVMRLARGDRGILGVVAEILRVPRHLERAVDMTLGGALQHVVCQAQEDAKRYIDKLRENRAGRATFLPLDAVRGRTLSPQERECLSMPGCLGVASELVDFDEAYRPVVENLLGRTVIAQDLASGIAIMRKGRQAFRLVTVEGDVMHSGGSMTGGSVQARATSLLSREREIAEYQGAVGRLETREREAADRLASLEGRLDAVRASLIALQEGMHEQEIALEREQSHRDHAHALMAERRNAFDRAQLELAQIESSIRDIDEELGAMESLAGGEEQSGKDAQQDIAAQTAALGELREREDALREETTAARVALAAAEKELEASRRDETRREQERLTLRRQAKEREEAFADLALRERDNAQTLLDQEQALASAKDALDGMQRTYRTLEIRRTARQQEWRDLLEKREERQREVSEMADRSHRLEIQASRLQADLENLVGRIWDAYELTYAGAKEHAQEGFDDAQAGIRIEAIRRETRAMGSVNTAAIEDYRATSERHAALLAQRDDLGRAKGDLLDIIDELTRRMEARFTEQFLIINQNFAKTFRELFGGGRAELRLADEKNPLTCGIDIVAQPPGKKLQLLSLLSGGERTLTAIAILFAMLRAKPTPFCILDEIEAALDENNVANFADFLTQYARSTQFIVVTHRKGTMERCDTLYGIAMEEKGVSSTISVELSAIGEIEDIG